MQASIADKRDFDRPDKWKVNWNSAKKYTTFLLLLNNKRNLQET